MEARALRRAAAMKAYDPSTMMDKECETTASLSTSNSSQGRHERTQTNYQNHFRSSWRSGHNLSYVPPNTSYLHHVNDPAWNEPDERGMQMYGDQSERRRSSYERSPERFPANQRHYPDEGDRYEGSPRGRPHVRTEAEYAAYSPDRSHVSRNSTFLSYRSSNSIPMHVEANNPGEESSLGEESSIMYSMQQQQQRLHNASRHEELQQEEGIWLPPQQQLTSQWDGIHNVEGEHHYRRQQVPYEPEEYNVEQPPRQWGKPDPPEQHANHSPQSQPWDVQEETEEPEPEIWHEPEQAWQVEANLGIMRQEDVKEQEVIEQQQNLSDSYSSYSSRERNYPWRQLKTEENVDSSWQYAGQTLEETNVHDEMEYHTNKERVSPTEGLQPRRVSRSPQRPSSRTSDPGHYNIEHSPLSERQSSRNSSPSSPGRVRPSSHDANSVRSSPQRLERARPTSVSPRPISPRKPAVSVEDESCHSPSSFHSTPNTRPIRSILKNGSSPASPPVLTVETTADSGQDFPVLSNMVSEDEDSLFIFDNGEGGNSKEKVPVEPVANPIRKPRGRQERSSDDDTSVENDYGFREIRGSTRSPSLQARTQQAWENRTRPKPTEGRISFATEDKVHSYEPKPGEHDRSDDDSTLMTDRSFNSTYSKSMESEAEDIIKDFFFIGSGKYTRPGKRPVKSSSDTRRNSNEFESRDKDEDDGTLESVEDEALEKVEDYRKRAHARSAPVDVVEPQPGNSLKSEKKKAASEDPLTAVWDYVEGGINVFSEALGMGSVSDPQPVVPCSPTLSNRSSRSKKKSLGPSIPSFEEEKEASLMEIASDFLFSAPTPTTLKSRDEATCEDDSVTIEDTITNDGTRTEDDTLSIGSLDEVSFESLSKEGSLLELAQCAARARHEIHGAVYDERHEIDVMKDLKFSVVTLALPLGLLFQENGAGCWVTKVFEGGNASRSGRVKVGDQLAAIHGKSTVKLKVDSICTLISSADNPKEIELTFLRYIGPLRPMPGTEPKKLTPVTVVKKEPVPSTRPRRESPVSMSSSTRTDERPKGMSRSRSTPAAKRVAAVELDQIADIRQVKSMEEDNPPAEEVPVKEVPHKLHKREGKGKKLLSFFGRRKKN